MHLTPLSPQVDYSIGISTGNTYVGTVGSHQRHEHALVGDTVNSAARLAGKAMKYDGNVLCDHVTFELASDRCRMDPEGELKVCFPLRTRAQAHAYTRLCFLTQ